MEKIIRRRLSYIIFSAIAVLMISALLLPGCSTPEGEGFAIYLTANDIDPTLRPKLSQLEIAQQPVISLKDFTAYNPRTHEITLTADAYNRISGLETPVRGKAFVVCIDRKPVYQGAFWTPVSSYFFEGVIIMIPLGFEDNTVIKLTLHQVESSREEDPRSNPEIIKSLEKAGKLSIMPLAPWQGKKFGHSMKGWELYSWQEGNDWHFTLMYGTNRNKYLDEIISIVNSEQHNHVTGVEAIKSVLGKLPEGEFVTWFGSFSPVTIEPAGKNPYHTVSFELPSSNIVEEITGYAIQHGLDFYVNK